MANSVIDNSRVVVEFGVSQIKNYMRITPAALLVYDHFLTFSSEVELIWPSKMSIMKVLYFVTKYLPFVDVGLVMYLQLKPGIRSQQCKNLYLIASWLVVFGIIIAEGILMIRTWAIWSRGKRIGIALLTLSISAIIAACIIEGMFLGTLTFAVYPDPTMPGCVLTGGNRTIGVSYIIIIIVETIVLILTLVRGVQLFRHVGAQRARGLAYVLYRDGILFYIYLFGISVLNFIVILTFEQYGADLLTGLQRVLHSCISARVLLNLRGASVREQRMSSTGSVQLHSPVFAAPRSGTAVTVEEVPIAVSGYSTSSDVP